MLGFMQQYNRKRHGSVSLFITSDNQTVANITIPGLFRQQVQLQADELVRVDLPISVRMRGKKTFPFLYRSKNSSNYIISRNFNSETWTKMRSFTIKISLISVFYIIGQSKALNFILHKRCFGVYLIFRLQL